MKILIKNGTVVNGTGCQKRDILIEDEKIKAVEEKIEENAEEIVDAAGKLIFPGFIDAHTHFDLEVANTVTADDFLTGTRAAIKGGTTTIIDFATQNKGESLMEALENWHRKADGRCSCDYGFHMAISDWNEEVKKQIGAMIDSGVSTFKLYMTYPAMILSDGEIYEVLKTLKEYGTFAGVHCENASLIDAKIREHKALHHTEPKYHPICRPASMEAEAVHRLLVIAKEAEAPVMVVHVTSKEALDQIRTARLEGQKVFGETCPQYLLLDETYFDLPDFEGASYVCSPPMRAKENQKFLWDGLKDGYIQTISTDHCSFTREQKRMGYEDFTKIPNGMPGVETRGELIYTYGVDAGIISPEQMCRFLSENPARLYGLYPQKGTIQVGSDADLVMIDPKKEKTIHWEDQQQNVDYAPFEGFHVKGTIWQVYLRGAKIVEDGNVIIEKKGGFLRRNLPQFVV